jgi:hypothetical protein
MIKKLLVTVAAAGALSVPLAGVAGADPTSSNPGTPGDIGGARPGTYVVAPNTPHNSDFPSTASIFREFFGSSPGGFINQFAPPNFPPAPQLATGG